MEERNPTKVHSIEDPNDELFNRAFQKVLFQGRINEKIGSWRLSNINSQTLLDLFYEDMSAAYTFQVESNESSIVLWNSHREAQKGKGTESLKDFERMVASFAKRWQKRVKLVFPKFGQEDTAVWLEKNGYSYDISNDTYEKEVG